MAYVERFHATSDELWRYLLMECEPDSNIFIEKQGDLTYITGKTLDSFLNYINNNRYVETNG